MKMHLRLDLTCIGQLTFYSILGICSNLTRNSLPPVAKALVTIMQCLNYPAQDVFPLTAVCVHLRTLCIQTLLFSSPQASKRLSCLSSPPPPQGSRCHNLEALIKH